MQYQVIQRILGLLLMVFSLTMLPPALVGWLMGDIDLSPFWRSFLVLVTVGTFLWLPVRRSKRDLRLRDGFLVVTLFWAVLGLSGSLPLILSEQLNISVTDAVFESLSGLTTTGATVMTGLESLPYSILFYRQQLQWLGGMGIIVLAVAILPMLGVGGMQLYRAETPGPLKDAKLTPRITGTAKLLWYIYLLLTIACILAYWIAGMSPFDAISHAFSTVSIGGFSTHDASLGYFDSALIESIAILFMLLSGINFGLHFLVWRKMNPLVYLRDSEFRFYIGMVFVLTLVSAVYLLQLDKYHTFSEAIRHALFHVVSIATTTGFTTTDYSLWPGFLPVLLLFSSFVGGCAASTAGGMKVIRFLLLLKQGMREVNSLVHPNARFNIKVNGQPVREDVVQAVWGFFAVYIGVFAFVMLILLARGHDQVTAFSAVAATLNNLGPGLGNVATSFVSIDDFSKWWLCLAMLMGRLELFTVLVLLTPAFWRK
ncbi:TrkH family potassium uptake protein [Candidatus Thiothrix anitrata]|jgi:trk system potassium uptake protein TrkH|uniref:Trk system potassium uptake protein n=1 Tax=Candidatus Thiothrix anitrata TaxID=2823902 RepID=A0ABX7X7F7_9GAMM|nr:TrkH family potassium uptake protein [Candidatus Thiothrix anitrata]QTR51103.1 potassium transporter [Candidatus Thiothrix anitrata]